MGSFTKSQTSKTTPVYNQQLEGAAGDITGAYRANQGNIQGVSDQISGLIPSLLDRFRQGDPALSAASSYVTRTLGGGGSNPHLQQVIDQTGNDVTNQTHAAQGTRGLTGGTAMQDILTRNLASNAGGLRFADWNNEQQRMANAAGMAPGIAGAQSDLLNPAFNAAQSSLMPLQAANMTGAGIGGLLGQYTNGVQKQNPSTADSIGKGISILSSLFSDERLKTDVRKVGKTDGGLNIYTYRYQGAGPFHMGVMAQEVPVGALGPEIGGYKTVRYEEVR
jgi:hypothetical protein